jgi:hypothetical protein
MKKPKAPKTKFNHVKMVIAGLMTTGTEVRSTAEVLFQISDQKKRNAAMMAYLYSLGVPRALIFDNFRVLFEKAFPKTLTKGVLPVFPINMDYDQDNCHYVDLVASANVVDQKEIAAP